MHDAKLALLPDGMVKAAPTRSHAAIDRLSVSRSRLRQALLPGGEQNSAGDLAGGRPRRSWFKRLEAGWRRWRRQGTPLTAVSMALRLWGGRSAWPGSSRAQDSSVGSIVRRHPWLTVAAASAAGASLVLARPWRWSLVRGVAFSARLQATDLLVGWLVRAPLQRQLASLFADWSHPANDSKLEDDEEAVVPVASMSREPASAFAP